MQILSAVRSILVASPAVNSARQGDVYVNAVLEGAAKPNVQLMLISGLEEFTHQGPSGLVQDRVRIWSRALTVPATAALGKAVRDTLQGYTGTVDGTNIQLITCAMSTSDYQEAAGVHRQIEDYDVHWGYA